MTEQKDRFRDFLQALVTHWWARVTGPLLTLGLLVSGKFGWHVADEMGWVILGAVVLLPASYFAWRDERRKALELENKLPDLTVRPIHTLSGMMGARSDSRQSCVYRQVDGFRSGGSHLKVQKPNWEWTMKTNSISAQFGFMTKRRRFERALRPKVRLMLGLGFTLPKVKTKLATRFCSRRTSRLGPYMAMT
jgi:hypothetical protein